MNKYFSIQIILVFFLFLNIPLKAQTGEKIFKTTCAACHKISNKRLIGPGLANIDKIRTKEWFVKFVKSSQTVIKGGDPDAVKLFKEYNNIVMPNQPYSTAEIGDVYEYIKSKSQKELEVTSVKMVKEKEIPFEPTKEDILIGQNLFSGKQRFKNGGPSCLSCHHVRNDKLIAGGLLGKELTDVYDRLKKEGIASMVMGLPFPQMKSSYQNHKITKDEAYKLTAFFKDASEERYYQRYGSYTNTFLIWGVVGAIILMGVFPLFWYNRKKESVNKRIYERQIKSCN